MCPLSAFYLSAFSTPDFARDKAEEAKEDLCLLLLK